MTTLASLLKSSGSSGGWGTSGSSGWGSGSSSTWGGKANTYTSLPTIGKKSRKKTDSQRAADDVMAKTSKHKGSKSLFGEIMGKVGEAAMLNPRIAANLVGDLVDTAESLGPGLLKTATTNPVDTAKAVGADYSRRYSPLLHGQFKKFGNEIVAHPLAPLLDVATVATLGSGAGVKAGLLSGELETTGLRTSRALEAGAGAEKGGQMSLLDMPAPARVEVNLSRNPATRQVQKAGYGLKRILPENMPVLGERASAQRNLGQQYLHRIHNQDAGTRQMVTKEFVAKYGEQATEAIQKYATTQAAAGNLGKATQLWKDAVLAGRPAFITNNLVGNQFMYQLGQGIHQMGAFKALGMSKKGELERAWNENFQASENTLGGSEAAEVSGKGGLADKYRGVVNKSYNLQGRPELWLRKATMRQAAMANEEIRTLTRKYMSEGAPVEGKVLRNKKGRVWGQSVEPNVKLSEGDALARAINEVTSAPGGEAIKREITQKIEDTLGNYNHYNRFEANLKKAVPFYGWNRHSTRFLYSTARDRPGQLLALHQIGQIGEKEHALNWAGTPSFMNSYVDIGGHTYDTHALNPLQGATDTLKAGKQLVSGDSRQGATELTSSINPFIAAGIQAVTGKSLLSGAPVERSPGGAVGSVVNQIVKGLPQVTLAQQALKSAGFTGKPDRSDPHHFLTPTMRLKEKYKDQPMGADGLPTEPKNSHMLNATFESKLASFLGLPDRGSVNKEVARKVQKSIDEEKADSTGFHKAKARKKAKKKHPIKALEATTRSNGWGAGSTSWGGG